jgi:hypothetical protein
MVGIRLRGIKAALATLAHLKCRSVQAGNLLLNVNVTTWLPMEIFLYCQFLSLTNKPAE